MYIMKKNRKAIQIAAVLAILFALSACGLQQEGNRTVIKEPNKRITVLENENIEIDPIRISVEKIDKYDGTEITDWLDEQTVVLARENREFEKMSLLENAEFYPRSLYLYNLDTKEFKTLKAQKNMFFGGAALSPDKKHLLYYEYSIGDTAHYLMSMDNEEQTSLKQDSLGIAITAEWADAQNAIGVSYAGGAYMADISGNVTQISELEGEQLYTVRKMQDKIYYITADGPSFQLYMLDLATREKMDLKVENADGLIPSPDRKQILISQRKGSSSRLLLANAEGNILKTIVEGTEVTGASWSPDQRMIAYRLKSVVNGTTTSGLYLYDVLTEESRQIAVEIGDGKISWSPSGKKIAITEMDERRNYNSSILYLK